MRNNAAALCLGLMALALLTYGMGCDEAFSRLAPKTDGDEETAEEEAETEYTLDITPDTGRQGNSVTIQAHLKALSPEIKNAFNNETTYLSRLTTDHDIKFDYGTLEVIRPQNADGEAGFGIKVIIPPGAYPGRNHINVIFEVSELGLSIHGTGDFLVLRATSSAR